MHSSDAWIGTDALCVTEAHLAQTMKQHDRILIVKEPWLNRILSGEKNDRGARHALPPRPLLRWTRGEIVLGVAKQVRTEDEWNFLRPRHRVAPATLPYRKTYALPVVSVQRVAPTPFVHPRGAINIVKYRRA